MVYKAKVHMPEDGEGSAAGVGGPHSASRLSMSTLYSATSEDEQDGPVEENFEEQFD